MQRRNTAGRWLGVLTLMVLLLAATVSPAPDTLDTYREMLSPEPQDGAGWRFVKRGALGLALFGVASWMLKRNTRPDEAPESRDDREPRPGT